MTLFVRRSAAALMFAAAALLFTPVLAQETPELIPTRTETAQRGVNVLTLNEVLAALPQEAPEAVPVEEPPPVVVPEVIATYPHDPTTFTQGLEFVGERLYESAGEYGHSDIREVEVETGEALRITQLPPEIFAEGLTRVGDRLLQLSWREGVVMAWDAETDEDAITLAGGFVINQEGWGLCYDGEHLWHSNGSPILTRRDPETFAQTGAILVTRAGLPVTRLNELECVAGSIYANVWYSPEIMQIDPTTGAVTRVVDASALVNEVQSTLNDPDAVLNGIAYRASTDTFFITGKLWPTMYEVRFGE